jgi:hypothetical protein
VLARIAHDLLPLGDHIDLINVAFENPRVVQASKKAPKTKPKKQGRHNKESQDSIHDQTSVTLEATPVETSPFESCPDRETGRKAFKELQSICPNRIWRFIAVRFA